MAETERKKILDKRFFILVSLQTLILIFLIASLAQMSGGKQGGARPEQLREAATKLQAAGMIAEAIPLYESYLDKANLDGRARAEIAYSLGELYEEQGLTAKALSWYYQVLSLEPTSDRVTETNKKVVSLLEKLGKVSAAKSALSQSTALEQEPSPEGAVVVATVGSKSLYLHQMDEAIDNLPQEIRKKVLEPGGKKDFLKQFVAQELFYDKAKRLGLDKDPQTIKQLSYVERQLLVQKLLEDEIYKKISADEQDLRNFFEANKDKYAEKSRAEVSLIKVKSKELASQIVAKLEKGENFGALAAEYSMDGTSKKDGGKLAGYVYSGEKFQDFPMETTKLILSTQVGRWTKPILSQGAYSIFLVRARLPERKPTFDSIRKIVELDYKMQKGQRLYQDLIDQTIQGEKVTLYSERVK